MVARDGRPLALERGDGEVVALHDLADALAQEERRAAHAEVGVEVRDAHGLRVALEEGDVVGLEDGGHELDEHVLVAARVDWDHDGQSPARRVLCVQMNRRARVCAARAAVDERKGRERVRSVGRSVCPYCRGGRREGEEDG